MQILGKLAIAWTAVGVVAVGLAQGAHPPQSVTVTAKAVTAECGMAARFDSPTGGNSPTDANSRLAAQLRVALGCKQ